MCYDVVHGTLSIKEYEGEFKATFVEGTVLIPFYHTTGFDHFEIPVITNRDPEHFHHFSWGLIPNWARDPADVEKKRKQNINARGEDLFERPSYKAPARSQRCMVILDGYFEHHHKDGKAFPHLVRMASKKPFAVAGLWDAWRSPAGEYINSVAIITTKANPLMRHIHNAPKFSDEPRMPAILDQSNYEAWLSDTQDKEEIKSMLVPYPADEMEAYTVPRLKGKAAIGNKPEAVERRPYPELETQQGSLF